MDLNLISSKLEQLQQSKPGQNNNQKFDRSQYFWKAPMGKTQIRFVPYKENKENPFTEVFFHYGIGSRTMISPVNYGDKDPIVEFSKELRKTSEPENWRLAKKLEPKMRIFAPVVVRGEEDKGVRLWGFGITIYKALLALAEDEDVGDFTDVINGWDLVVEQREGNPYPETTVRIKPKQTALSDNNDQVDTWLKTQPNPVEVFTQYDYDFIKKQLQNYLNPGSAEESAPTAGAEKDTPESSNDSSSDFTLENATAGNQDTVSKFDDLFNE